MRRIESFEMTIRSGSNQVFSYCPNSSLRSITHTNFSEYVLHVLFDRFIANSKHFGDFLVGQTESHLPKHFTFTLR